jgi:hypothetical protein
MTAMDGMPIDSSKSDGSGLMLQMCAVAQTASALPVWRKEYDPQISIEQRDALSTRVTLDLPAKRLEPPCRVTQKVTLMAVMGGLTREGHEGDGSIGNGVGDYIVISRLPQGHEWLWCCCIV